MSQKHEFRVPVTLVVVLLAGLLASPLAVADQTTRASTSTGRQVEQQPPGWMQALWQGALGAFAPTTLLAKAARSAARAEASAPAISLGGLQYDNLIELPWIMWEQLEQTVGAGRIAQASCTPRNQQN